LAVLLSVNPWSNAAQAPKSPKLVVLKPASSAATTKDAKVAIAQHYMKDMAAQANLDISKPQLSTDGFLSQEDKPLASSECLIAQTLLGPDGNRGLDASQVDSLCRSLDIATPAQPENYQTISKATQKGPTIDYALIHIVKWTAGQGGSVSPVAAGNWYLFDRGSNRESGSLIPWRNVAGVSPVTATTHLLGSKNVAFLAIQLGIDDTCGISYGLTSTHTTPLNQKDVANLIQTAVSVFGANSKTTTPSKRTSTSLSNNSPAPPPTPAFSKTLSSSVWVGIWGGEVIVQQDRLPADLALTPTMTGTVRAFGNGETKKTGVDDSVVATCSPVPKIQGPVLSETTSSASRPNFQLASYSRSEVTEQQAGQGPMFSAAADPDPVAPNTAAANAGNKGSKDSLSGQSQTVANEPTHHWDVSVAMPVTTYKSLKYDSTDNLLVPKTTSSLNPYALFDIYPVAVDLAAYSSKGIAVSLPKFAFGIPIADQPLQKPFVGTGFVGSVRSFHFQPIVGLHIQREVRANSPTSTLTHTEWHAKLQVMVGFSILDAKKVLGIK
jgi:hypothetical protein